MQRVARRVLLTCSIGGAGHLSPIAAAARAVREAGDEALVLVPASLAAAATREEIPHHIGGTPPQAVVDGIWQRVRSGSPRDVAGLIDRELFAGHGTRALLDDCRGLVASWAPDLIIREPCEYAGAVVALEHGIPQAQVGISQSALEWSVLGMVAPIIDGYRQGGGVAAGIARAPYLTRFPTALDPSPWADTRRYRSVEAIGDRSAPESGEPPTVYVTFGSVLGHLREARTVFETVLAAVAPLPARILMTVGTGFDPKTLVAPPANVRIVQWLDHPEAFAAASLVVCHGGSGTVLGALGSGVPLVICPLFADQPVNGRMVSEAGAGLVLESGTSALRSLSATDVPVLRAAVERVLREQSFTEAARAIGTELGAQPQLAETLTALP